MSTEVNQLLHREVSLVKPQKPANKKKTKGEIDGLSRKFPKSFPPKSKPPRIIPQKTQTQSKKSQSQTQSVVVNIGGKKGRKSSAPPAPPAPPNRFPTNFPAGFNPANPNLWYTPPPPNQQRQYSVFAEGETSRNLGINSTVPVPFKFIGAENVLKPEQPAVVLADTAAQIFEPPPEVAFEEAEEKEEPVAAPVAVSEAPVAESYAFPTAEEIESARVAAENQPPVGPSAFGVEKGSSVASVEQPKKFNKGAYVAPENRDAALAYDRHGLQYFTLAGKPVKARTKAKEEKSYQAPFGAEASASYPAFDARIVAANPLGPLRVPPSAESLLGPLFPQPSTGYEPITFTGDVVIEEPKKARNPLERGRGSAESDRGRSASLGPLSSRSSAGSGISPSENLLFT